MLKKHTYITVSSTVRLTLHSFNYERAVLERLEAHPSFAMQESESSILEHTEFRCWYADCETNLYVRF